MAWGERTCRRPSGDIVLAVTRRTISGYAFAPCVGVRSSRIARIGCRRTCGNRTSASEASIVMYDRATADQPRAAVREDDVGSFLATHGDLVTGESVQYVSTSAYSGSTTDRTQG